MKWFRFFAINWSVLLMGCASKDQTKHEPSDTEILRHYLTKTFNESPLPFTTHQESNLILITGHGCSYCNKKVIDYIKGGNLGSTYVITSKPTSQSELIPSQNIYFDTIENYLQSVNLRCSEGPVFLKLQHDSVIANIFITSQNVDSLFNAIEN